MESAMKRTRLAAAALIAAASAAIALAAAPRHPNQDDLAIASARISLSDAIAVAERHVGGIAAKAEYEKHDGRWTFDVDVLKGNAVTEVWVSPDDGSILSAKPEGDDDDD
jgi:uncharacterized membrane protein YkoI